MTIKKLLTLIITACCLQGAVAQVVLSTHHLELKKVTAYQDALPAPDAESRGLVVFASDKHTVTALRYNRVLYYADSLAAERPTTRDYELMVGYSYSATGMPSAYWANTDYTKIQELQFDFDSKKVNDFSYEIPFKDEEILLSFSQNNSFYVITLPKGTAQLYFYVFNEGKYVRHTADFGTFKFTNSKGDHTVFANMIDENGGIKKMENPSYNTLPSAAGKLKLFVSPKMMQLTCDQNPAQTQLFTINTDNYTVTETLIAKPAMEDADTNAFVLNNRLYQVGINREEITLQGVDIATGTVLKSYRAGIKDTISFKNSELLEQTGNRQPKIFKNTKKFIRRADMGYAAISAYQTPNDILVVSGAIRDSYPAGEVIVGLMASGAMVATGVGGDAFSIFPEHLQSVYIESLFDEGFNHKDLPQQHLASDYIGQYMYEHEKQASLVTVFPYDYYYVAGYYDAKAHQYVLVKFMDDGVR